MIKTLLKLLAIPKICWLLMYYTNLVQSDMKLDNKSDQACKNFKAVGQTQAELHSLKCEKWDACIKPLFANSVAIIF